MFSAITNCRALVVLIGLLLSFSGAAQTIEFEPIPTGPYGRGSSISVLFKAKGVFPRDNVFELYLSDTVGNFGTQKFLDSFQSHYTTFINASLAAIVDSSSRYRLRIIARQKSNNAIVAQAISPFSITISNLMYSGQPIKDTVNGVGSYRRRVQGFINCNGGASSITLENTGDPFELALRNHFDTNAAFTNDPPRTFTVATNTELTIPGVRFAHYSLFKKATVSGLISTRTFFYLNNKTTSPFSSVLATICYDSISPGPAQFKLDVDRQIITPITPSAYYNFPGYTYDLFWDDGTSRDTFTIQEIDANGGFIEHKYRTNSCGKSVGSGTNQKYNSIGPTITVLNLNPPCASTSSAITPIQVFVKPKTSFIGPDKICTNKQAFFYNTSAIGTQGPASSNALCAAPSITYRWVVDGTVVLPYTNPLVKTFTAGTHTITLRPSFDANELRCEPDTVTKTICVENIPAPNFKFLPNKDSIIGCSPLTVEVNNLTVNPTTGCGAIQQRWQVFTESGVEVYTGPFFVYLSGDSTSPNPKFRFDSSGRYQLRLTVRNSCDTVSISRWVNVSGAAGISFGGSYNYCLPQTINFASAPHRPAYVLGTGNESYNWTVTPRNPATQQSGFVNGTGNTSAYPQINFSDTGLYTVSVTFLNACNQPTTRSQQIRFHDSLGVRITSGLRDTSLCNSIRSFTTSAVYSSNPRVTYQWSISPATPVVSNPSSANTSLTFSAGDTNRVFQLAIQVQSSDATNPCPIKSDQLTIRFLPSNKFHPFNGPKSVCSGENFTFTANSTQPGSSYSYTATVRPSSVITGHLSGTGVTISQMLNNTGNRSDTVYYVFTAVKDGCTHLSGTLKVAVNPKPADFTITNPALSICNGASTNISLSATTSPVSYTWTASGSSNVSGFGNSTSPQAGFPQQTLVNTGTATETVTYQFTVLFGTGGACSGITKSTTVDVKPGATAANAGSDQNGCDAPTFTLAGNTPLSGTGLWAILSPTGTSATISNPTQANATLGSIDRNVVYKLVWTISATGSCGNSADTVSVISYSPIPAPPTANDSLVCNLSAGITIPLKAAVVPAGSIQWSFVSKPAGSAASIGSANSFSTQFGADLPGTYTVQYILSNASCPPQTGTRTYKVFRALAAGTLSGGITLCQGGSHTITANGYTGVVRKWQLQDLSPVTAPWRDTAITTPTLSLANVQQGVRVRMVLQSDGAGQGCNDTLALAAVEVKVDLPSVEGVASGDQTYCANSGSKAGSIQLTGQRGSIQWQQLNGSAWTDISGANSTVYSYNLSTTTRFRAKVTSGVCAAAFSNEVAITFVNGASGANAGADQTLCAATTTNLAALPAPVGFVGQWTVLSANGSSASLANAAANNSALSGLFVGDSIVLQWKISGNAACPDAKDTVVVKVRSLISPANAGRDTTLCDFVAGVNNSIALAATARQHFYETSQWTILTGNPTGATLANNSLPGTTLQLAQPGSYLLEWRIANDAVCPAAKDTVTIAVFDKPFAPVLSGSTDYCQGQSATLTIAAGGRGEVAGWQQALAPAYSWQPVAGSAGTATQTFPTLSDSLRVRVIWRSAGLAKGCGSADTSAVFRINVAPPSNGGTLATAATVCKTANNGVLTLTGYTGTIVRWEQSANGTNWQPISNTQPGYTYINLQQTTHYRAVVKSGVCAEAFSTPVIITVVDPATPASAGPDQILCNATSATLSAGAVGSAASIKWMQVGGTAVSIANDAATTTQVTGLAVGDYKFEFKVEGLGTCPTTRDTVILFVRPLPTQALISPDSIVICNFALPNQNAQITVTANLNTARPFETGTWSVIAEPVGGNGSFTGNHSPSAQFSFQKEGQYLLEWLIANDAQGCGPTRDSLRLYVVAQPALSARITVNNADVCAGNPATFSIATSAITGQISKWQIKRPYTSPVWKDTAVTATSISFPNLQDTLMVRLVVRANDTIRCPGDVVYDSLRVNVAPPSLPGIASGTDTICTGTNSGAITLSGQVGQVVNWQRSTDSLAWTDIAGSGGIVYNYSNLTQTLWFRAVVRSGVCSDVFSTAAKITVFPDITQPNAGPDITLCADTVFQLNANAPRAFEQGQWSMVSPAGSTAVIANPLSPVTSLRQLQPNTTYTLRWTIDNGGVCADKFDHIVITNTGPLTNVIDTATVTICQGQAVPITGQMPNGGQQPYLYQWQVLQNGVWVDVAGATQMNYTYAGDTVTSLRRKVVASPCENFSLPKTIYVQPPIGNNSVGGNGETCINTAPSLLNGTLPTGGDDQFLYQWQQSADSLSWTDIAGATGRDYQPPVLTITTFYRRVVRTLLCSGAQASNSAGFRVTVRPDAKAQWSIIDDTACAPFLIDDGAVKPMVLRYENSLYQWYANGNFYGSDTAKNPGYLLVKAGDSVRIRMVAVSHFGCKNDSLDHWFFTIPKPVTSFEPGDTVKCGPAAISFTNTTPLIDRFRYEWNFGNGQQSTLAQPAPVTYATNPSYGDTIYYITLKAITECDTVATTRQVRIKSRPKALFAPDRTNGCSPMAVRFSNISKGLNVQFRWDFGDGTAPVFTNRPDTVSHTYNSGLVDTFYARLIATNECGGDTSTYAIVIAPRTVFLDMAVNGNEATGCAPHTVRFINRSQGGAAFRWDFGDGNILNTTANVDTVRHTYLQAGTFRATVQATNNCSDTADVEIIRVFASPVAEFSALPSSLCIGDTVQFSNLTDTATGYLWQFADGSTSTLSNPAHHYAAAGTYEVTLISTRQYGTGNACRDTISHPVVVVPGLPGRFSNTGLISGCVPYTTTFTNQSLPAASVQWDFGDGTTGTGNTVSHTFTRTGLFVVKMQALDPGGCTYVHEDTVRVNGPSGSWTYDAGYICNAAPVRFQLNVLSTDSVRIDFGDGSPVLTTTQPVVYHSYPVSGLYLPKATLLFGPGGSCRVTLPLGDTIKSDVVKAGFVYAQSSECGRNTLQFTDTSRSGFGLQQWQWTFGDGGLSNVRHPAHAYLATNNYPLRLIVKSTLSGCSDTALRTLLIRVKSVPVAAIQAAATGCADQNISFTSSVQSQDTVTFFRWNFSNNLQVLSASTTQQFAAGSYTVQLIAGTSQGCYDTARHSFIVHPSPVTRTGNDQRICRGQSVNLSASGATAYEWFPQDGSLSCISCANPVAKPITTTQYIVTGSNGFGCRTSDTLLITVVQPIRTTVAGKDSICIGSATQLVANGADSYQWSPGTGLSATTGQAVTANPQVTTRYRIIGADAYNCFQDTAYVTVAVGLYPTVRFPADTLRLATGAALRLTPVVTNGPIRTWQWTPANDLSCTDCPSPLYTPRRSTCITAKATTAYGCSGADTICITTFCENAQVFIPNAFTPDGDGRNDLLIVRGTGINQVKSFRIFNRWGQVVFERSRFNVNDASNAWDGTVNGKKASPDVYVYTCEVTCENGTSYTYKGNVAIIQ